MKILRSIQELSIKNVNVQLNNGGYILSFWLGTICSFHPIAWDNTKDIVERKDYNPMWQSILNYKKERRRWLDFHIIFKDYLCDPFITSHEITQRILLKENVTIQCVTVRTDKKDVKDGISTFYSTYYDSCAETKFRKWCRLVFCLYYAHCCNKMRKWSITCMLILCT